MRTRKNPIPSEYQRPRPLMVGGFADDEGEREYQDEWPVTDSNWDNNCDGETYENLDLRHLLFLDASLVGTKFINCDLRGCTFYSITLTNTEFINCDLRDAWFTRNLNRLQTERDSMIANFEGSDLRGAKISKFTDYKSKFNWNLVRMESTKFDEVEFVKYVYDLHYGEIENPNLYIDGLPRLDRDYTDLRDFNFQNAKFLKGANLYYSNLEHIDLRCADLRDANLRRADLQDADLRFANLQGANIEDADLRGADLRGADLRFANLQGANSSGALYNDDTQGLTKSQKSKMKYTP